MEVSRETSEVQIKTSLAGVTKSSCEEALKLQPELSPQDSALGHQVKRGFLYLENAFCHCKAVRSRTNLKKDLKNVNSTRIIETNSRNRLVGFGPEPFNFKDGSKDDKGWAEFVNN